MRLKWRLQAKVCSPQVTDCVVGRGGIAEEGEGPWRKVGDRLEEGVAWGGRRNACEGEEQEEVEVRRVGNEEVTSFLEEGAPTWAS